MMPAPASLLELPTLLEPEAQAAVVHGVVCPCISSTDGRQGLCCQRPLWAAFIADIDDDRSKLDAR